jgi:mono/diheme cytochrome c family protein
MLKTTFAFLSLSLATVLLGCGEEPVPAEPSFATDVRPIFIARCVRCHGAGDKLNGDPLSLKGAKPEIVYLGQFEDTGMCKAPVMDCKPGAKGVAALIKLYVHDTGLMRMPPLPAESLSDRQLQIIDLWASKTPPNP